MDNLDFGQVEEVSEHITILYAKNSPFVSMNKREPCEHEFVWSEQNNLGIPKMDSLHKMMFETAVLVRLITRGLREGDYEKGCDFLLNLIKEHFRIEECLMRTKDYPKVQSHEIWYQDFLSWLEGKLYTNATSHSSQVYEKVSYIEEWIIDHIFDFDFLYAEWLTKNEV